mgnify:CR=1 FL=1
MENRTQILILDCLGRTRPGICFTLELAGYDLRVVNDINEAINLIGTARFTGEIFDVLLINNPCLEGDVKLLLSQLLNVATHLPVVFVKSFEEIDKNFTELILDELRPGIFYTEPLKVKNLLAELKDVEQVSQLPLGRYG